MASSRSTSVIPAGTYTLDPDTSTISFATRHWFGLGGVAGTFGVAAATVRVGEDTIIVDATVDAASFTSGSRQRDAKVRSATFLDAAAHPDISFHSDQASPAGDGWTVDGLLTVRGTSAPVTVAVTTVRPEGDALLVEATAVIDRYALGVTAMKGVAARTLAVTFSARCVRT